MPDTQPVPPDWKAAYQRLYGAIEKLDRLELVPSGTATTRYSDELAIALIDTIAQLLIERGIFTEEEYGTRAIAALHDRSATFEQRLHHWLDGRKDMPL